VTHLAPALVRRIDRLASHAHAFHRFAHHPLCSNYRTELLELGKRGRICRGCAFAALGTALGIALGAMLSISVQVGVSAALLGSSLLVLSLRLRLPKLVGRFLPALLGAVALLAALRAGGLTRWCALAGVPFVLLVAREVYRVRGPNRAACLSCPERTRMPRCSGFAPIVRRERAFQRLAQRWIDAARPRAALRDFVHPK